MSTRPRADALVLFGITGDLAYKKLFPALYHLSARRVLDGRPIIGVASSDLSDDDIRQFVKDNAWGHHASCTNPMGKANDNNAVVDSNFKVIGVDGLRVVDASIFPRIPGFFIVTPIYMIAEKASDVIMAAAKK